MKKLLVFTAMLGIVLTLGATTPTKSMVLDAVDDAYVVTDASVAEDPQGLRDQNFGNLEFVRVWYVSKVQKDEQLVSVGLVKFDLKPLKDLQVESATLQLFAIRADLTQPSRLVDLSVVQGPWSEKDVSFNRRPAWSPDIAAVGVVFGAGRWYSWDVTGSVVAQIQQGTASYVLGLRTVEEKKEEQVVFASREVGRNAPRLVVTYTTPPTEVPWWVWVAAIAGAAVVAFGGGVLITRRTRTRRSA